MASQTSLLGSAGEHYVLCQLLRRDWVAAIAPEGVPNTDIIITDIEGNKQYAIQVKSRRNIGSAKGWHMGKKHESIISDSLIYCFVDMGDSPSDSPVTYVIPSRVVATVIKAAHAIWLKTPGKTGNKHNDSDMRRLQYDYSQTIPLTADQQPKMGPGWLDQYRESWDLLNS
jgi:hypothetical protein